MGWCVFLAKARGELTSHAQTSYAGHEVVGTKGIPLLGVYKGLKLNFIRPRFIRRLGALLVRDRRRGTRSLMRVFAHSRVQAGCDPVRRPDLALRTVSSFFRVGGSGAEMGVFAGVFLRSSTGSPIRLSWLPTTPTSLPTPLCTAFRGSRRQCGTFKFVVRASSPSDAR